MPDYYSKPWAVPPIRGQVSRARRMKPGSTGWMFILANEISRSLTIGVTPNLYAMIREVMAAEGKPMRRRRAPRVRLVYVERHEEFRDAVRRCHAVRRWPRRIIVDLIEIDNAEWRDLSATALGPFGHSDTEPAADPANEAGRTGGQDALGTVSAK
jgi:predicted GIY-YIG superfamily endonuclease